MVIQPSPSMNAVRRAKSMAETLFSFASNSSRDTFGFPIVLLFYVLRSVRALSFMHQFC